MDSSRNLKGLLREYALRAGERGGKFTVSKDLILNALRECPNAVKLGELSCAVQALVNRSPDTPSIHKDLSDIGIFQTSVINPDLPNNEYNHVWVGINLNKLKSKVPWFRYIYAYGPKDRSSFGGNSSKGGEGGITPFSLVHDLIPCLEQSQDLVVQERTSGRYSIFDIDRRYMELDDFLAFASEEQIRNVSRQILSAIRAAHSVNVIGLNISVNILLVDSSTTVSFNGDEILTGGYIPVFSDFSTASVKTNSDLGEELERVQDLLREKTSICRMPELEESVISKPNLISEIKHCEPMNISFRNDFCSVDNISFPSPLLTLFKVRIAQKIKLLSEQTVELVNPENPLNQDRLSKLKLQILTYVISRLSYELGYMSETNRFAPLRRGMRQKTTLQDISEYHNKVKITTDIVQDSVVITNKEIKPISSHEEYITMVRHFIRLIRLRVFLGTVYEATSSGGYESLASLVEKRFNTIDEKIPQVLRIISVANRCELEFEDYSRRQVTMKEKETIRALVISRRPRNEAIRSFGPIFDFSDVKLNSKLEDVSGVGSRQSRQLVVSQERYIMELD